VKQDEKEEGSLAKASKHNHSTPDASKLSQTPGPRRFDGFSTYTIKPLRIGKGDAYYLREELTASSIHAQWQADFEAGSQAGTGGATLENYQHAATMLETLKNEPRLHQQAIETAIAKGLFKLANLDRLFHTFYALGCEPLLLTDEIIFPIMPHAY